VSISSREAAGFRRPTSADVARAAGVSRATVSYVLNDRRDVPVAEATRRLVLEAARELNYQPSPAARALRAGYGEVVLVLLPEWASTQFADVFAEVGNRISAHGLVCLRHEGPQWRDQLPRLLGRVTAAAVITMEPLLPGDAAALERAGVPEIRLWWLDDAGPGRRTAIDQAEIVRHQVDHLLERGFRRLAYVALEAADAQRFLDLRVRSFKEICQERGLSRPRVATGLSDLDAVATAVQSLRRRSTGALGLCAWSDITGLAILNAARTLQLDVPGDVGVIGVDDTPTASLSLPALSSVRLDLAQEAALTAQQVAVALGIPEAAPPAQEAVVVVARSST
jgi:DNA-binding LacI/PurR family transcriptional regulator